MSVCVRTVLLTPIGTKCFTPRYRILYNKIENLVGQGTELCAMDVGNYLGGTYIIVLPMHAGKLTFFI
jgi:hypothetical protein